MFTSFATAAVLLIPVATDDARLGQESTFVSQEALRAIAGETREQLHCLELPAGHPAGALACLTAGEWQAVFDRAAQQDSAMWRERAMMIAHAYKRPAN